MDSIQAIIPSKGRRRVQLSVLRSDVNAVTAKLEELTKAKNDVALAEWRAKRQQELTVRHEVGFWVVLFWVE